MPVVKWKYSTHRINPFRLEDGEIPYGNFYESKHRMTWRVRKDALVPRGGHIGYQAKCKCGWQDMTLEDGAAIWIPKRMIHKRYALHIIKIREQGEFDV